MKIWKKQDKNVLHETLKKGTSANCKAEKR